jgi:ferrochelatase
MNNKFDAILLLSFGGPEGPDDVMPFLRNVVRGKNVPDERLRAVAHHYELFGGVSPINEQNRKLIAAIEPQLRTNNINLPIYWGNRNWHPMLEDTVAEMASAGIKRAIAFATSAYSSYSGCRQYLEDIDRACAAVGANAPEIEKIKPFYGEKGFRDANFDRLREAICELQPANLDDVHVAFTAHSIPLSMAKGCNYENQLTEVAHALASRSAIRNWDLVFQSRSGPPAIPWLAPDINDHLVACHRASVQQVVVAPIGFVSDHMEVIYDLDIEAKALCKQLGLKMVRAQTVGTHPAFVRMICQLISKQIAETNDDIPCDVELESCGADCCIYSSEWPTANIAQEAKSNTP